MRPTRHKAFGLIELLVVISIITLLVGLLLPTLHHVRASAQRVACLSNLRQVGIGLQAYRDDHGDQLPAVPAFPVDPHMPSLMTVMQGYIDAQKAWRCPAEAELFAESGTSYEYFMGHYLMLTPGSTEQRTLLRELEEIASIVPVATDADGWHPNGPGGTSANALFLDGRADWFYVSVGGD